MELPLLNGVIGRRILINYRAKPEVVKALLIKNGLLGSKTARR